MTQAELGKRYSLCVLFNSGTTDKMDKTLVVFYFKFKTIFQSNDFKHKVDSWYNTVNQICHTETQLYIQSSKPGLISMKLHYFGEGQV